MKQPLTNLMLLLAASLFAANSAIAADEWLCTQESSKIEDSALAACGIGVGKDEDAARAAAFENAHKEFLRVCDTSDSCRGRKVSTEPKRTSCEPDGNQIKCYRLVRFLIAEQTEGHRLDAPSNSQNDLETVWMSNPKEKSCKTLSGSYKDVVESMSSDGSNCELRPAKSISSTGDVNMLTCRKGDSTPMTYFLADSLKACQKASIMATALRQDIESGEDPVKTAWWSNDEPNGLTCRRQKISYEMFKATVEIEGMTATEAKDTDLLGHKMLIIRGKDILNFSIWAKSKNQCDDGVRIARVKSAMAISQANASKDKSSPNLNSVMETYNQMFKTKLTEKQFRNEVSFVSARSKQAMQRKGNRQ